jgi:light-regulated signal transduction histidine kinase (bacteriophytochrome)
MDLLAEGILNYSLQMDAKQEGKEVNVQTLVKHIISANTSENVTITLENRLPRIIFSESKLVQVFQNLIQNAIKHNNKKI